MSTQSWMPDSSESSPPPSSPFRLLILGAGPTALGALHRLVQLKTQGLIGAQVQVQVLEQELKVGGLASTVVDDHGFSWDLGVHVMGISKYPDFVDALAECVPEWRVVPRCAMADMSHVMAEEAESQLQEPTSLNANENGLTTTTSGRLMPVDCYVPYPVQNSLPYFPQGLKQRCLQELAAQLSMNREVQAAKQQQRKSGEEEDIDDGPGPMGEQDDDFDTFSLALFGPTLQRIFIRPYNEKVWTVPLGQMGTRWLRGRVPLIDWAQLSRRCALARAQLLAEDGQRQTAFRYPAGCRGVGEMWQRFAGQSRFPAGTFRLGHRVVGIDPTARLVRTVQQKSGEQKSGEDDIQGGDEEISEWPYDLLVSTMPLTELCRLSKLCPQLALKWSTVLLVGVGLSGGQSEFARQLSWAYYPRPEIVFYRCTVLSNFSPELVPQQHQPGPSISAASSSTSSNSTPASSNCCSSSSSSSSSSTPFWSVLCEIGQSPEAPLPKRGEQSEATLVECVIQDLIRVGVVHSRTDVCSTWLHCLPFGYPVPTRDRDVQLAGCHATLEEHKIYSRGRFGGWRYEVSNQDHSFQCGLELIDRLFLGIPEQLYVASSD